MYNCTQALAPSPWLRTTLTNKQRSNALDTANLSRLQPAVRLTVEVPSSIYFYYVHAVTRITTSGAETTCDHLVGPPP